MWRETFQLKAYLAIDYVGNFIKIGENLRTHFYI